ncbi:unnamed protein product [Arctia plantaginis]|uniref:Uncharacterized protein n=1 Tax=Arctia plantaginis TaxID=874455 RepID=A0A8S0ZZD1_ARCPL|nr:unnamed protein product [Arctia plantaginis]CAB3257815.1 unnamed protein product [Arctia plantaginis]
MVLLTDNTIKELRSSTTPTSQFSSLHFIASTAIGEKSIETAQTLHESGRKGRSRLAKNVHQNNCVGRAASKRFGANWQTTRQREFSEREAVPTVTI